MIWVAGCCPMGCGQFLMVGEGNALACSRPGCPDPAAAHKILADDEAGHVVEIDAHGWSAKHPLRERLGDALLSCDIHEAVETLARRNRTALVGRYRVEGPRGAWTWTRLP